MDGLRIDLLDVGDQEYGDATLLQLGGRRILIDGAHTTSDRPAPGHPSLPEQIDAAAGAPTPRHIDLLIVSHPHLDHIGCLPSLVDGGTLQAAWALIPDPKLGWPKAPGPGPSDAAVPDTVRQAVAGWREEPRSPAVGDAAVGNWLADAVSLEANYLGMIENLRAAGTKVILFGRDDPAPLLAEFAPIGMEILGPSQEQLLLCAFLIAKRTSDAIEVLSDRLATSDTIPSAVRLYRHLAAPPISDADLANLSRPGPFVNLQSGVVSFRVNGRRLLFTGDSQLADPESANLELRAHLLELRAKIRALRPYAFVKLPHHGSPNGFDVGVLKDIGRAKLFGFESGSDSHGHPNRKVLRLLAEMRPPARWVRTDVNGRVTVEPAGTGWRIRPARGQVSETRVSDPALSLPAEPVGVAIMPNPVTPLEAVGQPAAVPTSIGELRRFGPYEIEFTARVPANAIKLTVTVDFVGEHAARTVVSDDDPSTRRTDGLAIAGGRPLPPLLFVTSVLGLRNNISAPEADQIVETLRAGFAFLDVGIQTSATESAKLVTNELVAHPELVGVVIVGGYDVVPAQCLDTLPRTLAPFVNRVVDLYDRFVVWSDDLYGYATPERQAVPVSRIPDARSHALLRRALTTGAAPFGNRRGIRNVDRPFADSIFSLLPGAARIDVSRDTTAAAVGASFQGDAVYLMLHGSSSDTSRFWGERDGSLLEAFNVSNVAESAGATVFAGACWGALSVDVPAIWAANGRLAAPRAETNSIALTYLARGARAFVGSTGEHYSPPTEDPPVDSYGLPMHREFWTAIGDGESPAMALATAKRAYLRGIPSRQTEAVDQAIEYKTLRQFTCLGLGW